MLRTALTAQASLTVTDISNNYDIDTVPDSINRGQLPVLLVLPIETDPLQSLFSKPDRHSLIPSAFCVIT